MKDTFTPNTFPQGYIDVKKYNKVVQKLREFFTSKGFLECHPQSRLSILAACEDPKTIATFEYNGEIWPLPQTGQIWLEYELLRNPDTPGFFCVTTSYRNEPNPIPGRHEKIFPMFEIEFPGDMNKLAGIWREMLQFLGYPMPVELEYEDMCRKYGVETLENEHETQMYEEYGCSVFLKNFPVRTSPFWNMALYSENEYAGQSSETVAKKIDLILSGQETAGSAMRSSDVESMRQQFYTISEGMYAQTLFDKFTKERVEKELNDLLSYNYFPRSGAGIGLTRLIRSLEMEGLLD